MSEPRERIGSTAVTAAVIPAAGLGTRFLPATKALPKEMLPVVDRPMIQYAVAEAAAAGAEEIVIVTAAGKESIERHFAPDPDLERTLRQGDKDDLLAAVHEVLEVTSDATVTFVTQHEQLGLGHAVAVAREAVGDRPFAVLLPDEIITSGLLTRMAGVFEHRGASVIGLMEVPPEEISSYGCPEAEPVEDGLVRVRTIVEKPAPADAPSSFATIGRYVFTPEIFDALDRIEPGVGGELQLTDAIDILARKDEVYGALLQDGRYDVGRKIDFLRATVELALDRPDLGPDFEAILRDVVQRRGL